VATWVRGRNLALINEHCKDQCGTEQGSRELETGPAAVLLGQGLMAPRAEMGSWAVGRCGEAQGKGSGVDRSG